MFSPVRGYGTFVEQARHRPKLGKSELNGFSFLDDAKPQGMGLDFQGHAFSKVPDTEKGKQLESKRQPMRLCAIARDLN
jgi:hypothetical protein